MLATEDGTDMIHVSQAHAWTGTAEFLVSYTLIAHVRTQPSSGLPRRTDSASDGGEIELVGAYADTSGVSVYSINMYAVGHGFKYKFVHIIDCVFGGIIFSFLYSHVHPFLCGPDRNRTPNSEEVRKFMARWM